MDNLFGMIRKNRIFGKSAEPDDPYKVNFDSGPTNKDIVAEPQDEPHPMMDQYKSELNRMPTHDDYKPSVKGKIGAVLAGVSAFTQGGDSYKATKNALDDPYNEAEDEWSKRIARTGELASIEERTGAAKAKNSLDWAKYGDEHANAKSLNDYRGVQSANLKDEMSHRGEDTFNSPLTGTRNKVDKNGNVIWSLQNDETPGQKDTRELGLYGEKGKIGLKNDEALAAYRGGIDKSVHQANEKFDVTDPTVVQGKQDAETFKNGLLQDNINLRNSLQGVSPEQQTSAFGLAISKAMLDNPEYSKFMDSSNHFIGQDDPDYTTFRSKVAGNFNNEVTKNKKGPQGNPLSAKPGNSSKSKVTRADILKEIKTQFPNNPEFLTNKKYIQDAMKANGAN